MYEIIELEKWKSTPEKVVIRYSYPGEGWVLISLKKGASAGHHYHKGLSKIKDPERMVIISGEIELYLKDVNTSEEKKVIVKENSMVKIKPNVYHEVKAVKDTIFLESFSDEAKDDRFEL